MSSNLNICDLGSDVIPKVTDYLPYQEKIELVDLFPCIREHIKVFDTSSMRRYTVDEKRSLFQKLANVHKVIGKEDLYANYVGFDWRLQQLIFSGSNKKINHFSNQVGDPIPECGGYVEKVLTYIENVKKKDILSPDRDSFPYNASCIKNIIDSECIHAEELMKKYPDLKLKFGLKLRSFSNGLQNPSLHDKIVYMRINGDFFDFFSNEFQRPFESLVELSVIHLGNQSGKIFIDYLKNIFRCTPNLMELYLPVEISQLLGDDDGDDDDVKVANEFINTLFSITTLNQLTIFPGLFRTRTQKQIETFQNIVNQLLTSRKKPGLKKLCITSDYEGWDILQMVSNIHTRNDFKYLKLERGYSCQKKEEIFEIKNHGMRVVNIKPPIQYLFSRFPRTKWIDITTDDESYLSTVYQEYQSIIKSLKEIKSPKNRWLQINVTVKRQTVRTYLIKDEDSDSGTSSPDSSDEFEAEATVPVSSKVITSEGKEFNVTVKILKMFKLFDDMFVLGEERGGAINLEDSEPFQSLQGKNSLTFNN